MLYLIILCLSVILILFYIFQYISTNILYLLKTRQPPKINYLKDSKNKLYRLGDMVRGYFNDHPEIINYYYKKYPDSIASLYMKNNIYNTTDYNLLLKIVDIKLNKLLMTNSNIYSIIPLPNSLVVHLRTGDIIDKTTLNINDIFSGNYNKITDKNNYYDINCHNYVRPINYYKSLLSSHHKLDNITIVTGFNNKDNHIKSLQYIFEVKKIFENQNKKVTMRINNKADNDFIFMCNSKYFNPSGGGFSKLISEIVILKNNRIIE